MSGIINALFGRKDDKQAPAVRPAVPTMPPALPMMHPHLAFPQMFNSKGMPVYGPPPRPLTKRQKEDAHKHWKEMKERLDKMIDDARERRQNYGGG